MPKYEYSVYSGDCDYETCPIRVDSGFYAGTSMVFSHIKIESESDDPQLSFNLTFLRICEDGKELEDFSSTDRRLEFGNDVASEILLDIILSANKGKTNEQD